MGAVLRRRDPDLGRDPAVNGLLESHDYGTRLVARLATDLTKRFGRGFGAVNLAQMRKLYQTWPTPGIFQTASEKLSQHDPSPVLPRFPLSWSHYVRLLSVEKPEARTFYEAEALRGGWTVRQLDRQVGTQFYERTLPSIRAIDR